MGVVYKSRGISSTMAKYTLVKHELDMTIEHGKRWVVLNNVPNVELEIDSAPYTPSLLVDNSGVCLRYIVWYVVFENKMIAIFSRSFKVALSFPINKFLKK